MARLLRFQQLEDRLTLDGSDDVLRNGEECRREVGLEDPFDRFFFNATADDYVWVSVGEERAKANSDVELIIRSPSGVIYSDVGDSNALQFFQAPESGQYRITVQEDGNNTDFDYKIRLIVQPRPLDFLYSQDAFLDTEGSFQASLPTGGLSVVQFDATEASTIVATLGETSPQISEPIIWIVSPTGTLIDLNGPASNGQAETGDIGVEADFVAPESGVYTAIIGDRNGNDPMNYTFSLASLPGAVDYTLPQNAYLQNGERREATIGLGEQHIIQFDATANGYIIATLGETTTTAGEERVWLLDPLGRSVDLTVGSNGVAQTNSDVGLGLEFSHVAQMTGLYTAIISDDGNNDQLDYTFSLASLPGVVDYSLPQNAYLRNGERRQSTLGVGEQHMIQFDAVANGYIIATLGETTTTDGEERVWLIDPLGRAVDINGGSNVVVLANSINGRGLEFSHVAQMTGLYTAIISDDGNDDQLDYTFSLASLPGVADYSLPQNAYLQNGERRQSTLGVGEQHIVQFDAVANGAIIATLAETTTTDGEERLWLLDPLGRVIDINGGSNGAVLVNSINGLGLEFTHIAQMTGLYTAIISDDSNNDQLDYSFRVAVFPYGPDSAENFNTPLVNNTARQGVVQLGDFSVYPFYVDAQTPSQISVVDNTGGSAVVRLRIVDRTGSTLWNGTDASQEVAFLSASNEAGLYFAIVSESEADRTLSYSITATGVALPFSQLPGDFTGNRIVDDRDFAYWRASYGAVAGPGLYADGNSDGVVDAADYTVWRKNQGAVSLAATLNQVEVQEQLDLAFSPLSPADEPSSQATTRNTLFVRTNGSKFENDELLLMLALERVSPPTNESSGGTSLFDEAPTKEEEETTIKLQAEFE